MIENVPTASDLQLVSLRLYFRAWADVIGIITEWAEYGMLVTENSSSDEDNPEWRQYVGLNSPYQSSEHLLC